MKSRIFALLPILISCTACETTFFGSSIPEGLPPSGQIVADFKEKQTPPSPDVAINKMASELIMKLSVMPARPAALKLNAIEDGGLGDELFHASIKSKMAFEANGQTRFFTLESKLDNGIWRVRLLEGDRPLWINSFAVDTTQLELAK